jgi:nucleotide-binding universal stress UspA family protein
MDAERGSQMSRRYVVGIDGSRPSQAALSWAADRAERDGREIVLAHVETVADATDPLKEDGRDLLRACLEQIRDQHPRLSFAPVLTSGAVARELVRVARLDDMLVIGTHKTGHLTGRVLGSRSIQIAMATECTVAVIPDIDLRFRRGVVAGIDRHETAAEIARFAAREARDLGHDVLFLQSVPEAPNDDRSVSRLTGLPIVTAVDAARSQSGELLVRARVSDRDPVEFLLDASRGKALLVLGPGGLDPAVPPLRSVIHGILLNANAPVVIARPLADRDAEGVETTNVVATVSSK